MKRLCTGTAVVVALIAVVGCRTVEYGGEDRPWWHATLHHDSIPWPWPTGELAMIDYHDAHGAGIWDAPWVFAEQIAFLPTYVTYGIGETIYAELLGGSYDYDPSQWQWKAVNWTLGIPHAVASTAIYAVVIVADTVGHDPIAALWWAMRGREQAPE